MRGTANVRALSRVVTHKQVGMRAVAPGPAAE